MNQFGKFAEKIGILVQGGTVNVGQIRLDSEMSRQELRNRKALLNNVRNAWVEGVLEKSLHEQIPIVLGLENRPSAVASPWNMDIINPDKSRQSLPAGTPVIDVFDKLGEGGTLLILGEPGSGKTITLLQLAKDLIARAQQDIDHRIPVVLNLSSWAAQQQMIAKWIVEELNSSPYNVPKHIGQQWVKQQELILLLDGLDEIRDLKKRNNCVMALNDFQQKQSTEMVVCCRVNDYDQLDNRLRLKYPVVLQPLTTDQIQSYLSRLQSNLIVLKALLIKDVTLQELAQSPLLLSIMVLTYQGIEVTPPPEITMTSNRKKQLFEDYINRMFQGSRLVAYHSNLRYQVKHSYSDLNVTRWLIWMAQNMIWNSQAIFLIEKIQPYWIENPKIISYRIVSGLIFGLIYGLIFGLMGSLISGLILGVIFGLIFGLIYGLMGGQVSSIKSVESIKWSWNKFKQAWRGILIFGLIVGLFLGFILGLRNGLLYGLISGLIVGLISGLILGLIFGLLYGILLHGLISSESVVKDYTNQGIKKSAMNSLMFGMIGVLIGSLMGGLIGVLMGRLNHILIGGLCYGLIGVQFGGGWVCIHHFVLRLILYFTGHIPWNYAKFLDWASDKLFLQKVGGGYIFIHRSLMEHFAEMENG